MNLYISKLERPTLEYLKWINNPEVTKFTESRGLYSWKDLEDYIRSNKYLFGIYLDDKHIGNIKLGKKGDIGLIIDKPYWNHGYGTKAIKLITEFAFQNGFDKVFAGISQGNEGSLRAFEKNGFIKKYIVEKNLF